MRNGREQEENRNSTVVEQDDTSAAGSYPFDEHDQNASGMAAIEAQLLPQLKSYIRSESKAVSRWRTIVFAILSMAGLAVSLSVYFYVRNDERNDFEVQYRTNARKIVEVFHDIVERHLGALNTLSNTITSYAQDTNNTFPFVTLPHFAERGSDFRILANTLIVRWTPVVTDETREAWEAYALEHRHQIDESYESDTFYRNREDYVYSLPEYQHSRYLQENTTSTTATESFTGTQVNGDVHSNVLDDGTGYHPRLFTKENGLVIPEGSGPYMPDWQRSPVNGQRQALLNFDFSRSVYLRDGILSMIMESHEAIITSTNIVPPHIQKGFSANIVLSQHRHEVEVLSADPLAFLSVPVFDKFPFQVANEPNNSYTTYNASLAADSTSKNNDGRQVTGVVTGNLYWRQYFTNILTDSAVGITCVLSSSYNRTFSYQLDGPNVTFLGIGDFHDPNYDHLVISANVNEYVQQRASMATRSYTTVPLNAQQGHYKLHIYPTRATENAYRTQLPVIYTVVIASVFFVTMTVFILFAKLVEQRQEKVMDRALRSGAIVSSLFPEQVQDRLYEKDDEKTKTDTRATKDTWLAKPTYNAEQPCPGPPSLDKDKKTNAQASTSSIVTGAIEDNMNRTNRLANPIAGTTSKPIADLFPETTVMFADLAGFTSWSSNRSPVEVFELLETLYAAFDVAATKRNVFKVETIGDCYLAVTGLPHPQPDHAVLMAKFARDCLNKMNELVQNMLTELLGTETSQLQLRVGLHSGPVTAGVLRGQKSRFQLFGDTVNTAARMESTGKPGMIQASQATADALIALGRQRWVTTREDKVMAKGKGEMATYWITPARQKGGEGGETLTTASTIVSTNSL